MVGEGRVEGMGEGGGWKAGGGLNHPYPYRKHKLVCGCYKVVDKVNYNLVATLLQSCDNLVSTL